MTAYTDAKTALAELLVTGGRGRINPPALNDGLVPVFDALKDYIDGLTTVVPGIDGWDEVNGLGADIASGSTINLTTATGTHVSVTGTTSITAITLAEGKRRLVRFAGILTLTHGASLILPGAANITTAAGDVAEFIGYAAGVVRCISYARANGRAVAGVSTGDSPSFANLTVTGQSVIPLQTLTDAANIDWNCNSGAKAKVTLGGNRTVNAVTNATEGATYLLWVIQDVTGSRTLSWTTSGAGSFDFGADGAPTLTTTASKADLVTFEAISIGGTLKLRFAGIKKGFT